MRSSSLAVTLICLASGSAARVPSAAGDRAPLTAAEILDTAIARMGGSATLQGLSRVRLQQVVQWLTLRLDDQPHADAPSYNLVNELRDYTLNSSRSSRRIASGARPTGWSDWVIVVQDTVAMAQADAKWTPLHITYVDEQREAFATAPERMLLALRAAPDLRRLTDTMIAGLAYPRVTGTVSRLSSVPAVLVVRTSDGLPAMLRYRAAQSNDAQLAPYGTMEVEVWWSRWQKTAVPGGGAVMYPLQADINRVGRPFQRVTTVLADFNVPSTPDSFAINDSLRQAFFGGSSSRPMWRTISIDSGTVTNGHFAASWRNLLGPIGVLVGHGWLMLLDTPIPLEARVEFAGWLEKRVPGSKVAAGLVTRPGALGVGTGWLSRRGAPVYVAPAATKSVALIARNWDDHSAGTEVSRPRWIHLAGDSAWIEPFDLPTAPGSALVYVPSLKWVYSSAATAPADAAALVNHIRARGWPVDRVGSARNIDSPAAPAAGRP